MKIVIFFLLVIAVLLAFIAWEVYRDRQERIRRDREKREDF